MSIGNQPSQAAINQWLTSNAVSMRNLMGGIQEFQMQVTALGTTGLEALGYDAADAAAVVAAVNYMANLAGCYFGTVQQGGSGGTGAILYNFNAQLAPLWAGQ